MKIAYFDCFSGISGDMCLGALVDAGAPLREIEKGLKRLPAGGYALTQKKVERSCLAATKVDVILKGKGTGRPAARRLRDVERLIKESSLSANIKERGLGIFRLLFEAEAAVHGRPAGDIHLHELGAVDCLVDIFGTLIGLELLGVREVFSSPVNLGAGVIKTEHGTLPVPAPATAELMKGVPVYQSGGCELTTPTGAVILKALSKGYGQMPPMVSEMVGIGAGGKDLKALPNVLRVFIGAPVTTCSPGSVVVIETNIDDMNPQVYDYLTGLLLRAGALDVYMTQVIMKKMRPGIKLSVVCEKDKKNALAGLIMRETTTLGVRCYETSRITMERYLVDVPTKYGNVKVKAARANGSGPRFMPEYEDCRKIAEEEGVPLLEVMEEVKQAARRKKRHTQ